MAGLSEYGDGLKRIGFNLEANGARQFIRLGAVDRRTAEEARLRIGKIIAARQMNISIDPETAAWLTNTSEELHRRIAATGLVEPRIAPCSMGLAEFVDGFIAGKADVKLHTRLNFNQAKRWLVKHFGEKRDVRGMKAADADNFRAFMIAEGLSEATYRRHLGRCRELFRWAIRRGLFQGVNPFTDMVVTVRADKTRQRYITREQTEKLINAAPDVQWRLLIALSRYGGVRVPSEALELTWADVDFEHSRIRVPSPKTAHIPGKDCRFIPMFPELHQPLLDTFEQAEAGERYVITRYRTSNCNLRTHITRIARRAGLVMWPKPFHNMRASRQTELAETYPLHVVCAWLGNSKAVAAEHYLQVTDANFERAIQGAPKGAPSAHQKAHQQGRALMCGVVLDDKKTLDNSGFSHSDAQTYTDMHTRLVPPTGFEPVYSD